MTKKTNTTNELQSEVLENALPMSSMSHDLKTALLIVSVVANLFIFTAWVALQVTTQYDAQVASFLFNR